MVEQAIRDVGRMTIQELIDALQAIGNKDLPVVVYDGMDTCKVHQLVVHDRRYFDDFVQLEGLVLEIQGR